MKSIITVLFITFFLVSGVFASTTHDIQVYTTDNTDAKITDKSIEKVFKDAGFVISGNRNMHIAFKSKFQQINHKMYNLFYLHKPDMVTELVKVSPKAALFTPLSMSIYMKKSSNDISIASLSSAGMSKITGIPATNKYMIAYSKLIKDTIAKALPKGHFENLPYSPIEVKEPLVKSFTGEMEVDADELQDELEGFETELEGSLETVGFIIAGFNKLGDDFKKSGFDKYDFFDSYSICKLSVIFEISRLHPEAGALAPCSFYMYKEKGSTVIKLAYPSVANWFSSLAITDETSTKELKDAEQRITDVVNEVTE